MDAGHRETDEVIGKMEKQIAQIYGDAEKELQTKLDKHLAWFKVEDEARREMLENGEISQKQYNGWRREQMMTETRLKAMRETIAQDLHNSNNIARSVVNGYMPEVYAINHNFGTFQVEHDALVDTSYTLYDRQTVERLLRDDPDLLPPLSDSKREAKAAAKDIKWQSQQFNAAMTKSILMGDSIPNMAARISNDLIVSNMNAAVRYARTAATGAQNAGRVDSYERAQNMGIELEQEWLATLDNRTRDEHRELDGQHVPVGEPFEVDGEEIRYPGDPSAPGYLVWNCRCTLVPKLKNLDQSDAPRYSKLGDMSYEEWKNEHEGEHLQEKEVFKFTPASTIEEAEDYLRQYVDESRFGALGVSYRGVSVDVANEVNRTIARFYETFEVEKFGGVVAPAGNTKYGKQIQGATAAYTDVRRSFLLNRTSLKTIDTAEATFLAEQKAIQDILEHPEKYDLSKASPRLIRVVENSKVSGRSTIPQTIEETINHELGHSLERQVKKSEKYDEIIENMPQYAPNVSGYACENYGEYIGESFCSYMKGEGVIDPVLSSVFDSFRR